MSKVLIPLLAGLMLAGCGTTGKPDPNGYRRNLVSINQGTYDVAEVANKLVETMQRCWIGKSNAFSGLEYVGIGPGNKPDSAKSKSVSINFKNVNPGSRRHLRIFVIQDFGWLASAAVAVERRDAEDASSLIGAAGDDIFDNRGTSCNRSILGLPLGGSNV